MKGDYTLRWQVEDILCADESGHARIPTEDVKAVLREVQIQHIALELENRELRKSQRRLRDSRDRYRRHFELIPDGCLVLDADQTIREANEAATQLLNRNESELVGSDWQDLIHPDDRPEWELQRQQHPGGVTDHVIRLTNGRSLHLHRTSCHPAQTQRKTPEPVLLVIPMAQDSQLKTDRSDGPHEFLAELVASEQRHRVAIDATSEAIVGLTADAIVQTWNAAAEQLFGYRAQEILGSSILRFVPPERQQEMKNVYSTIRKTTSVVDCQTQMQTRDSQLLDVVLNIRSTTNARKNGPCALAIIRDVTELTRAREELRRRDTEASHASRLSAMGEMVAILVHEISQPLTVISAFAQTCISELRKEHSSLDNLGEPILQIDQQAKRAGSIIRSLKRFLAKTAAPRSMVNLNDEIRAVCKLMRMQIDTHKTAMTLDLEDSLPTVQAEGLQIQQVLVNLLQNSLEAMSDTEPDGRRIVIMSRTLSDSVQVSVSDTGHGFRFDAADRLFEPYFTTKDDGLGMGLTICERIVKGHDGALTAASNADRGTVFQFVLPRTNDESAQSPGPSHSAAQK